MTDLAVPRGFRVDQPAHDGVGEQVPEAQDHEDHADSGRSEAHLVCIEGSNENGHGQSDRPEGDPD